MLSKCSKAVDKKFKFDLDDVWDPKALVGKDDLVLRIVLDHFIREGRFDLAKTLSNEAQIYMDSNLEIQFKEMFSISSSLKDGNCDLAIEWASSRSNRHQSFEFNLHQFKYLKYVKNMELKLALDYARVLKSL